MINHNHKQYINKNSILNKRSGAVLFQKYLHLNIIAYFRLQHLHQAPYFGTILPNVAATKKSKIMPAKKTDLLWFLKCWQN
jgi:hypothetical protein